MGLFRFLSSISLTYHLLLSLMVDQTEPWRGGTYLNSSTPMLDPNAIGEGGQKRVIDPW